MSATEDKQTEIFQNLKTAGSYLDLNPARSGRMPSLYRLRHHRGLRGRKIISCQTNSVE